MRAGVQLDQVIVLLCCTVVLYCCIVLLCCTVMFFSINFVQISRGRCKAKSNANSTF